MVAPWIGINDWETFLDFPLPRMHRWMTWVAETSGKKGRILNLRQLETMLAVARTLSGDKSSDEVELDNESGFN